MACFGNIESTNQINRNLLGEIIGGLILDRFLQQSSSRVDHKVDGSKAVIGLSDGLFNIGKIPDVAIG